MKVKILKEAGHTHALLGMALSYHDRKYDIDDWWNNERYLKAEKRAKKLCNMDGGHNKFLESIMLWIYVDAPRSFWSEADTYRLSTKQSESTMHTLQKRSATIDDFEEGTDVKAVAVFNTILRENKGDISVIKNNLPEGYLQARIWLMSYKTLRNIIYQRHDHRLKYWQQFCEAVKHQCQCPEYLP